MVLDIREKSIKTLNNVRKNFFNFIEKLLIKT